MKSIFKSFLGLAAFCTAVLSVYAQNPIPNDENVIIGKLDNGMTYYVWHNANPEGCADFYIAHNVGALQEEDNQNGLAHFLEHMAFNGTEHYPDKELLEFLAKEGVRFGYNVNAYTSKTETVYNISNVPLVRESFVDSVLMILHDWSCAISCEQDALDAERGVISEEWRRRDDPKTRMAFKQMDLTYKGAKHTERSVLGTLEVINGFKRNEILDFYHKWYRPDLQAIIVVGDFDANDMKARIERLFSDIPAAENPAPKEVYPIPHLDEPLMEDMTDPQIKYQTLKVIHKQPFPAWEERGTDYYLKDLNTRHIVSTIVEGRFKAAAKKNGCPVKSAVLVTSASGSDFYSSMFTISPKNEDLLEETLAFYTREMNRILEFGITEDEFNVAKSLVENKFRLNTETSPDDLKNRDLVDICIENFLRGFPCVYPADYKALQKMALDEVTFEDAQEYLAEMFGDSEKIYAYSINEEKADKLPGRERMMEIIAAVGEEELKPEYTVYKKLDLSTDPVPGKIVKVREMKYGNGEIWTLDNGAKVYWIPSDTVHSDVHVAMEIYFDGGYKVFPQDRIGTSRYAKSFIERNVGFSNMDRTDLRSCPDYAGVGASTKIERKASLLKMNANEKNLEKGFEMAYLQLTAPNFSDEMTFSKFKKENFKSLTNKKESDALFNIEFEDVKYGSHPWLEPLDTNDVKLLDMDFVKSVFNANFSDFANMEVYICSDLDKETIKKLVEKYIASLNGTYSCEKSEYLPLVPAYSGETVLDKSYQVVSVPKTEVNYYFLNKVKPSPKSQLTYDILDHVMSGRYLNQIREARGGTYHVSFSSAEYSDERGLYESAVFFQTRPEMTDILVDDVDDLMKEMAEAGPSAEEMDAAVKYLLKRHKETEERDRNSLLQKLGKAVSFLRDGVDNDFDYQAVLESIDARDVKKLASELYKGDKLISIYREQ